MSEYGIVDWFSKRPRSSLRLTIRLDNGTKDRTVTAPTKRPPEPKDNGSHWGAQ